MSPQSATRIEPPPLITVGISTYNRKDYLRQSIRSIQQQTFKDFEIIVVDDGSTDDTGTMMANEFPGIQYVYQENQGDAAAKNTAAARACGRYLVFNDSDDLFLPDALERLYSPLKDHPEDCSYGQATNIDADGNHVSSNPKLKYFPSGNITGSLLQHIIVNNCATLMPRKMFLELGGYDQNLRNSYDYKFALKMSLNTRFHAIQEPVFLRRRHESNISRVNYEKEKVVLNVLEEFLDQHPEIREKHPKQIRHHLAKIHGRLAREAKKEHRDRKVVKEHLRIALRNLFTCKNLIRYLLAH